MYRMLQSVLGLSILLLSAALPVVAGTNLVSNSDFSLGNTGFSSDYKFVTYPSANPSKGAGHGTFEIGTNPKLDDSSWVSVGDHTTGSGNFMLVDGATSATSRIWYQTFNVVSGTKYDLSAWAVNFVNKNNPNLIFTINGTQVGSGLTLGSAGTWQNLDTVWTANSTQVTFAVVDTKATGSGNSFGLDDISLKAIPEASTIVTFGLLCLGGLTILRQRSRIRSQQ